MSLKDGMSKDFLYKWMDKVDNTEEFLHNYSLFQADEYIKDYERIYAILGIHPDLHSFKTLIEDILDERFCIMSINQILITLKLYLDEIIHNRNKEIK